MPPFMSFIISQFVCIPWAKRPFQNLENPADHEMNSTENVRIPVLESESEETLGAWFVHPIKEGAAEAEQEASSDSIVKSGEIVVLYLHGNAETRSQPHRKELYKIFQRLNYHVLAVDYRSYADSSFIWRPNELTLSRDGLSAYDWLLQWCHPEAKVFIWGHSLGTGVTSKLGLMLSNGERSLPTGYFLESPFSSLLDEIQSFYVSRFLPFDMQQQLREANLEFNSVENLKSVKQPIMILHAEDDKVVPFELGHKLFQEVSPVCDVTFKAFDSNLSLGHEGIYLAENLATLIQDFVRSSIEK